MWFRYVVVVAVQVPSRVHSLWRHGQEHQASPPLTISQSLPKFKFIVGFRVPSVSVLYSSGLSHSVTSDFCDPMDCNPPGSSVHGDSPGKRVGCHVFFQGIFLTQGSNPCLSCLLNWQAGSLLLVPPNL